MDKVVDKIERMIAGKGVDDFEISAMEFERTTVESKGGETDFISESDSRAFAIRLLKGSSLGYAYAMSDDDSALSAMVNGAVFAATYQDEDNHAVLPEGLQIYPDVEMSFEKTPVDLDWKVQFAVDLENLTRSADKRIKNVRYATLKETTSRFYIYNSLGIKGEYEKSLYLAYVYAVAEENGQSETGFGLGFSGTYEGICTLQGKVAGDAASRGLRMLGARRIKTGRYPVVIENGAMTELLGVLTPSFSGRNVVLGKSMLAAQRGERVFSTKISVIDDPLMKEGAGTCPFDGEGVSSRKVEIIKDGICNKFMTDSYWGKKLGTGTTASLRRGDFKSSPEIGISNLIITPGIKEPGELFRKLGKGVMLTGFMGIHTADPISGDFSVGASGMYFEGGEVNHPVRTFAVSGNILELMARVVAIGNDLEMFGNTGAPSIAFEFIDLGGE